MNEGFDTVVVVVVDVEIVVIVVVVVIVVIVAVVIVVIAENVVLVARLDEFESAPPCLLIKRDIIFHT